MGRKPQDPQNREVRIPLLSIFKRGMISSQESGY
jgi:hypothetical protein